MKKIILMLSVILLMAAVLTNAACGTSGALSGGDNTPPATNEETNAANEETPATDGGETEVICVVTFDSDAGQGVQTVEVKKGEKLTEPEQPNKTTKTVEYEFKGWYNGSSLWDFNNMVVTEDMTLTAHWEVVGKYTKPVYPTQ